MNVIFFLFETQLFGVFTRQESWMFTELLDISANLYPYECFVRTQKILRYSLFTRKKICYENKIVEWKMELEKINKKVCESGFPYCFLSDFTKFFLWGSMLLDFGSLTEEALWIYRIFKIWCYDKKN